MSAVDDAGGAVLLSDTLRASRGSRLRVIARSGGAAALLWGVVPVGAGLSAFGLAFTLLFRKPTRWTTIFA
ncbi:MAG TPA: hypothetical protein VJN70_04750, partial [Gemmatimonadaceae bacterium]|nr:hypothetical protein [Gemmatimonadaceae bacterium]